MKAVILAGGLPSSLSGVTERIPKPMVEIGGRPLLWHIMKSLSEKGINDFIICGGYKLEVIKNYFIDYYVYASDITIDLLTNQVTLHNKKTENWNVTIVDTGIHASLLKRIEKAKNYVSGDFLVTYGDCLHDININDFIMSHKSNNKMASMAIVKPSGRKSLLSIDESGKLCAIRNHDNAKDAWIDGDVYCFNEKIFEIMTENEEIEEFVSKLACRNELTVYPHSGYWTAIETMRDLKTADEMWNRGKAPWVKS